MPESSEVCGSCRHRCRGDDGTTMPESMEVCSSCRQTPIKYRCDSLVLSKAVGHVMRADIQTFILEV